MHLLDAEQPAPLHLQGVHFDEIGMAEHLGDAKLMLCLPQELVIFLGADGHDLESVLLAVSGAADVKVFVVCTRAKVAQDLKLADSLRGHECCNTWPVAELAADQRIVHRLVATSCQLVGSPSAHKLAACGYGNDTSTVGVG